VEQEASRVFDERRALCRRARTHGDRIRYECAELIPIDRGARILCKAEASGSIQELLAEY
jgi:hypothetical protein